MKQEVKSLEDLRVFANGFLQSIAAMPSKDTATVVGLSGDLGAGKTAFTKCIASILGITETVTSPTFILEKVYTIPRGSVLGDRFTKLIHIDAYRMESADEMRALDWDAIVRDEQNLVLIEWPEQVAAALPNDMVKLSFAYVNEGVRTITSD